MHSQASKPQLQRLLDRIGSLWTRGVVAATAAALAALLAAGVPLLDAPGGALYRALGVLVAGSPCAVVLVPLAYVCAMATVTRKVGKQGGGARCRLVNGSITRDWRGLGRRDAEGEQGGA